LAEVLGWHLPVEYLRYWVIGIPAPGRAVIKSVDARGRLVELEQDGWRVTYPEYLGADNVAGEALPRRLVVSDPRLRIRVVVDEWQFG
jgi:outer membrane lipoprotein LolB